MRILPLALLTISLASGALQALDGVWLSQGYGNVYQVDGKMLHAYEVTERTCVASFLARRLASQAPAYEAEFVARDRSRYLIAKGEDGNHKRLFTPDGLVTVQLVRSAALPTVCRPPTPNTAEGNFEVFARTFSEQYISFERRHIDWARVVAEARPRVNATTTPAQLFEVLSSMIRPLTDIHTEIDAPKLKKTFDPPFRSGTDRAMRGGFKRFEYKGRRELFAITSKYSVRGRLQSYCKGQIQYGRMDRNIGYLRMLSFTGCSVGQARQSALDSALDRIFKDSELRALIIDTRLSFGGDDRIGLAIASRLTASEYLAYSVQARADADSWTAPNPVFLRPSSRPGFFGPVVELTGPITMSAAETFTQALMGRTPGVMRIGESTQGVFCDVLDRHLPNGWIFGLPNAVYRSKDGEAFDVGGIPPDLQVPVYADDDVKRGKDPAMEAALRRIK